jgi:integrase
MVQQWVKDLQAVQGFSPSTIETVYVIFASIMRRAVRDGYIRKTPCDDIRLPEKSPTIIRLLTPAEVLALAAAVPRRYALLVLLGAGAGLRQGEAFGLAAGHIDHSARMITVSQQVIIVGRCPVLAPPKTSASVRDVPMPRFLQDAIAGRTLLRRDYYNREVWKPALTAAGLPADVTFHDLRHSLRQHGPRRGRAGLGGFPLAGAQVHHHHPGPVRPPGPRGERPCP